MSSQAAIAVSNVSKVYGEGAAAVHALRAVSFAVRRGEVVLLVGPSGSGKTTLLSVMGCILRPTSGSVRIAGREASALAESELPAVRRAHIGFIFQGFNLFPTLTAGENVELALDLKGIRGAQARRCAETLLAQVGLADKVRAVPSDLSGGQKQRVAIARALAGAPDIILADEPTAALDWHSGQNVLGLLRDLARQQQRAVVIVTHDSRAFGFADRIVEINDGRIAHPEGRAPLPQPHAHQEMQMPASALAMQPSA
jgi:putative ABC transport system ATP-binding protein